MMYHHIMIHAVHTQYTDLPPLKFEAVVISEDQDRDTILHFIDEKSKQCIDMGYEICGKIIRKLPTNTFKNGLEYILIDTEDTS